jgi:hypothetical protein
VLVALDDEVDPVEDPFPAALDGYILHFKDDRCHVR